MSHVRRIRPKKAVPKPKPMKIGSPILKSRTRIGDAKLFEKSLKRTNKLQFSAGRITGAGNVNIDVDVKIDEGFGLKKTSSGEYELYKTSPLSARDEKLLRELYAQYNVEKSIDALEKAGFRVDEVQVGQTSKINATKEVDGLMRTVEVNIEPAGSQEGSIPDEGEWVIKVHAVDFENAKQCKAAVDIVSKEIDGDIISEDITGEFARPPSERTSSRSAGQAEARRDNARQVGASKNKRR